MSSTRDRGRPRLAHRVAWSSAMSAALGGLLASGVSGIMAQVWVERAEDRELLRVTHELADELEEELEEGEEDDSPDERRHFIDVHGPRTLHNILVHELESVRLRQPRAAVRAGAIVIAGEEGLPDPEPGECVNTKGPAPLRVCGSSFVGHRLALAKSAAGELERRSIFLAAVALGIVSAAILAGFGSLFVARWALAPLNQLLARVRAVGTERPRPDELRAAVHYAELEELRLAIFDLVERLADALDRARAFAFQAAHELRTPLAALRAEVELLSEAEPDLRELGTIQKRLTRLNELVERLLTLATPGDDLHRSGRAVDLADVLSDVMRDFEDRAQRIELRLMEDPVVRGDEQLLRSVLWNAIENALKFSEGGEDPRVVVEVSGREGWIVVRVTDHGVGMTESEREQAFIGFYRSAWARASGIPGHGIGVALIQHVTRAHGGALRYLPASRGTVLEIELPAFS